MISTTFELTEMAEHIAAQIILLYEKYKKEYIIVWNGLVCSKGF